MTELPLFSDDPDAPWQPSVLLPGGGEALPYVARYVDENATTLPLLAQMYLRFQEAVKEYHKVDDDEWFSSKCGLVFAYACDQFLYVYSTSPDLQEKCTARQLRVLKEYTAHREARAKNWNLELRERDVMGFAVRFYEDGGKGGDAGMR